MMRWERIRIFFLVGALSAFFASAGCDRGPAIADHPSSDASAADAAPSDTSDFEEERLVRFEAGAIDAEDPRVAVLLHGYGSNEKDLVGLARSVGLDGPLVSLRAPERAGNGWAWFPINFGAEPRYAPDAADDVLGTVAAELRGIRREHPGKRVVVIGFSQGAMLTMLLAVEHPDALDQAIALSGTLPRRPEPPANFDPETAPLIYAIHGTADEVVSLERGRQAQMWLEEVGAEPTYNEYDGMGHRVAPAVINDLGNYLELPDR